MPTKTEKAPRFKDYKSTTILGVGKRVCRFQWMNVAIGSSIYASFFCISSYKRFTINIFGRDILKVHVIVNLYNFLLC